jgi:hypothetical protein
VEQHTIETSQKQSSNEILTKELNASLLDLLKEEIEQVKTSLLEHAREMDTTRAQVTDMQGLSSEVKILENKLKKLANKKKIDLKLDAMVEASKEEVKKLKQNFEEEIGKVHEKMRDKLSVKMDKKDLSHFLIKKVDTLTFNSQISVMSESLLGLKKKIGVLHSEFKNLPQPKEISENKIILKVEKKVKKELMEQMESNMERKVQECQDLVKSISASQMESGKLIEKKLALKADREIIQDLLKEQGKINEFICAENVLARFKVWVFFFNFFFIFFNIFFFL